MLCTFLPWKNVFSPGLQQQSPHQQSRVAEREARVTAQAQSLLSRRSQLEWRVQHARAQVFHACHSGKGKPTPPSGAGGRGGEGRGAQGTVEALECPRVVVGGRLLGCVSCPCSSIDCCSVDETIDGLVTLYGS